MCRGPTPHPVARGLARALRSRSRRPHALSPELVGLGAHLSRRCPPFFLTVSRGIEGVVKYQLFTE
jgi:hypothetical protein